MHRALPRWSKTLVLLPVLVLVLGTSAWAFMGQRCGMGMGMGMGMHCNLTPEQAAQVFDLRQKFMNDTVQLRKDMFVKKAELRTLWMAEKPDDKAILAKSKEMNALRTQLQEKIVALRLEIRKVAPQAMMMGPGRGMMPCPMGGPGMGPGKGMGPGMGPKSDLGPAGGEFDLAVLADLDLIPAEQE